MTSFSRKPEKLSKEQLEFFKRVKKSVIKLIRNTKQLYIKTKIAENKNNSWKLWNLSKCLSNDNKSAEHGSNNLVGNEKNIKKGCGYSL